MVLGQITCCYNCADRRLGCHGVCKDYNDEVVARRELNRQIRKEKSIDNALNQINSVHIQKRTKSNKPSHNHKR